MRLTVSRTAFTGAFMQAAAGVPARSPNEVMKNVLLSACETVKLRATDGEIGIEVTLDGAAAAEPGQVLLPTGRVQQIVREVSDQNLTIETVEGRLQLTCGSSEFHLDTANAADFPSPPSLDKAPVHRVSGSSLRRAIHRTIFACDVESSRYALGGLYFDSVGEKLIIAATDSRRLAVMPVGGAGEKLAYNSVVPNKAATLLAKVIPDADVEVEISFGINSGSFRTKGTLVTTQFVQGRFPDFRKVMPQNSPLSATVPAGQLASALRQASITAGSDGSSGVDHAFRQNLLRLNSGGKDLGSSRVDLPISYGGKELVITLEPRYLLDALRVLDPADVVEIKLIDDESAAVLAVGEYRYVVMPLAREGR